MAQLAPPPARLVVDGAGLDRLVWRLARELQERHPAAGTAVLCGVRRRGEPLALRLRDAIARQGGAAWPAVGVDVGPYRDDAPRAPLAGAGLLAPAARADIQDRTVILVDDVLFHGRTVRAALAAIAQLGRPGAVELCVLVDRGHRELPVRATYVGKNLPTAPAEHVAVRLRETDGQDGLYLLSTAPSPS